MVRTDIKVWDSGLTQVGIVVKEAASAVSNKLSAPLLDAVEVTIAVTPEEPVTQGKWGAST
jgi:hypothetical protein